MQTSPKLIEKYRLYMKVYGTMIVELSDCEQEVIKLILADDEDLNTFMRGLRELIENSYSPE